MREKQNTRARVRRKNGKLGKLTALEENLKLSTKSHQMREYKTQYSQVPFIFRADMQKRIEFLRYEVVWDGKSLTLCLYFELHIAVLSSQRIITFSVQAFKFHLQIFRDVWEC